MYVSLVTKVNCFFLYIFHIDFIELLMFPIMAKTLTFIDMSWETRQIPKERSIAKVISVIKKGDRITIETIEE